MTPEERDALLHYFGRREKRWVMKQFRFALSRLPAATSLPGVGRTRAYLASQRQWAKRLRSNRKFTPKTSHTGWDRSYPISGLALYRRRDISSKRLIVSFTGGRGRMMMATPDYLDATSDLEADVLLVRARNLEGYRYGLDGFAGNLVSDLKELAEFVRSLSYPICTAVGTSAGGLPAILFSHLIHVDRVIAVGPADPGRPDLPPEVKDVLQHIKGNAKIAKNEKINIVVGENAGLRDHSSSKSWQKKYGAVVTFVEGATHGAFIPFLLNHGWGLGPSAP